MDEPPDSFISKMDLFLESYKEGSEKKYPNKAIVKYEDFLKLKNSSMLMPKIDEQANGSYSGHVLQNDKSKIKIFIYDKLSEKKQPKLEKLIKDMKMPIIFCISGPIKKLQDPKAYDFSWPLDEIAQTPNGNSI